MRTHDHSDSSYLDHDFAPRVPMGRMAQIGALAMVLLVVLFIVFWNPTPPLPPGTQAAAGVLLTAQTGGQAGGNQAAQPTTGAAVTIAHTPGDPTRISTDRETPASSPASQPARTSVSRTSASPTAASPTTPTPPVSAQQPEPRTPAIPAKVHEVTDEDTLVRIAQRYYGTSSLYRELARFNKLRNPNTLPIGSRLLIPPREQLEAGHVRSEGTGPAPSSAAAAEPAASTAPGVGSDAPADPAATYHVVEPGDSYIKLSRRYYGNDSSWRRIAQANGLDESRLPLGRRLIIPPLAEPAPAAPILPANANGR
jgi:nucleoid-associated protein YgaU